MLIIYILVSMQNILNLICAKITLYVQILTITNVIKSGFHARSLIQQNDGYLKRQQQMEDDQKTNPSSYPKKQK